MNTLESPSLIHIAPIASGGMGRVELAVRKEGGFERLFAVKRLHLQFASDPAVRDMFLDEARIAGLLRHPNVVHVVDVGRDSEGPFLVMEYVEGKSLSQILKHHAQHGAQLPLSVALELVAQIARGLHAAHRLTDAAGREVGLVHRDVSPQNVLVSYDGCARLADFGIAKASQRATRTQTGVLKGKYGYLSPEQLRFEEATQRSDLFSLGIVLYEALVNARVYPGKGLEVARCILNDPPPDPVDLRPDVPPPVVALVFALLAKDPKERPENALVVADAIEEVLRQLPREAHVGLADYMGSVFGEERDRKRAEIAAVIGRIHSQSARAVSARGSASNVAAAAAPAKFKRRLGVALVAVGLGAAGIIAAFSGVAPETADVPAAGPDEPPVALVPEEPGGGEAVLGDVAFEGGVAEGGVSEGRVSEGGVSENDASPGDASEGMRGRAAVVAGDVGTADTVDVPAPAQEEHAAEAPAARPSRRRPRRRAKNSGRWVQQW